MIRTYERNVIEMKKKTLATAAILTGAMVGFASVTAIDLACKKRAPKKKKDDSVDPHIEKNLPWLKQQHFEDLKSLLMMVLKLKAKLLKSDLDMIKFLLQFMDIVLII